MSSKLFSQSIKLMRFRIVPILYIILILWIVLIFCLSMQSGKTSMGESSNLLNGLMVILNLKDIKINKYFFNIYTFFTDKTSTQNIDILIFFIRKLAHISEYFTLGLISIALFAFNFKKYKKIMVIAFFIGPLVAFIDEEVIQKYLTVGRTSSYKDILVDCFGFYLAVILILIIKLVIKFIRKYIAKHKIAQIMK